MSIRDGRAHIFCSGFEKAREVSPPMLPSDNRYHPLRKQDMHAAAVLDSRVIIEVKQQTADGDVLPSGDHSTVFPWMPLLPCVWTPSFVGTWKSKFMAKLNSLLHFQYFRHADHASSIAQNSTHGTISIVAMPASW